MTYILIGYVPELDGRISVLLRHEAASIRAAFHCFHTFFFLTITSPSYCDCKILEMSQECHIRGSPFSLLVQLSHIKSLHSCVSWCMRSICVLNLLIYC